MPFSNVIISSDEVRTWYDAVYVKIERPYRGGHTWAWGGGLSYTFGKAQSIGGDLFSFDYVFPSEYPKHPTTSDERHHIVGNWILDVPLDIQFSGLLTLGSGTPFVTSGPGIQPNASYAFPAKQSFIIPHAFAFRDLDARLSKSLTLSGTHRVELRAEGYNLLNFKNYGCFEGYRPSTKFGDPNCVVTDARYAQLGAQYTF